MSATARLVLDCKDVVGESAIWSAAERALHWVDIVRSRIQRFEPQSGSHRIWETPEYPTSIGLRKGGGFIVGLRHRVALWRPGGAFETFAVPEPDMPGNRLNEGVVAPDGSFWVGTTAENIGPDGEPQEMAGTTGSLYRIAPDGSVAKLCDDVFGITNTMVWLEGNRFVTADTVRNELYVYDHDPDAHRLTNRGVLAKIDHGLPDGSTRDAAGTVYNARVAGGAAIARLSGDGEVLGMIELPCRSPTSCAFGGPDLTTLYVTSARFGASQSHLAEHPVEGGLFAIDELGKGTLPHHFG